MTTETQTIPGEVPLSPEEELKAIDQNILVNKALLCDSYEGLSNLQSAIGTIRQDLARLQARKNEIVSAIHQQT